MSFGNIVGGLLRQGLARGRGARPEVGQSAGGGQGGLEEMLGSFLGGGKGASPAASQGAGGGEDLMRMAREFLGTEQAGGMSGAKIGGLGALAGGVLGGGLKGAAQGGALAILGTLALKAYRERQAEQGVAATPAPTQDEVAVLTDDRTARLVLQAMIGAAQADGRVDEAEMEKILGHVSDGEATEAERAEARAAVSRPVDVEAIGREVSRPEAATEIYLAALLTVDADAEAERDYLRRLAAALKLEPEMTRRLHRMTGAPL